MSTEEEGAKQRGYNKLNMTILCFTSFFVVGMCKSLGSRMLVVHINPDQPPQPRHLSLQGGESGGEPGEAVGGVLLVRCTAQWDALCRGRLMTALEVSGWS